jgi:hypothetical protein
VAPVVDGGPPPARDPQQQVVAWDAVRQTNSQRLSAGDAVDGGRTGSAEEGSGPLRRVRRGAARRMRRALNERLSAEITTPAAAGLRTEWRAVPVAVGIHRTPTRAGADSIALVSLEHSRALALSAIGPRGGLPPRQPVPGGCRRANWRASGR